jgi:hypothetical protein
MLHRAIEVDNSSKSEDAFNFSVALAKPPAKKDTSPSREKSKDDPINSKKSSESTDESKKASRAADPLRWFGILVPPALRSAQSSFVGAVEGSMPRLSNIARDLRNQEIEIGRMRKQIKKA